MNIEPFQTNDSTVKQAAKVMLVGHQGSGKTTAIADFYETYGAGLVLSGESGLSSISHLPIDYLPFGSFDRPNKAGKYTFMDLVKYVSSDAFKAKGYKWIALDSATELSQRCFADVEKEFEGSANGFEKWGAYERKITAALKWIRDLDTNVLITCLAAEENDDNGVTQYWPMLVQKKVQKLAPALYDHVFCLVRKTQEEEDFQSGSAGNNMYETVIDFFSATSTIFNLLTFGSIYVLRKKYPNRARPYKAFLYPTSMVVVLVLYTSFLILTLITAPLPSILGIGLTATGTIYYIRKVRK